MHANENHATPTDGDADPDVDWDDHDPGMRRFDEHREPPLWRRLHPDYRPHDHVFPDDDPWDDQRRIDGIIAQTHADLDGHPVEQVEAVLTKRFRDSNLQTHLAPDVVHAVALDIAGTEPTTWSARTLAGAITRRFRPAADLVPPPIPPPPETIPPRGEAFR